MSKNPNREPTNNPKKEDPKKEEGGRLVYTEGDKGTHELTQVLGKDGQVVDLNNDGELRQAVREMTQTYRDTKSLVEQQIKEEDDKNDGGKK